MISISHLFINETFIENTKDSLKMYFKIPAVKDFINLSKKVVEDGVGSLSTREQATYRGMFDDPSVQDYISAARKTGTRDGWIRGGIAGGVAGGAAGSLAGAGIGIANDLGLGGTVATFITLGLLGAAAGGATIGWGFSKVLNMLRKWQAEDDVVKLGRVGGKIGQTTPIVRADI